MYAINFAPWTFETAPVALIVSLWTTGRLETDQYALIAGEAYEGYTAWEIWTLSKYDGRTERFVKWSMREEDSGQVLNKQTLAQCKFKAVKWLRKHMFLQRVFDFLTWMFEPLVKEGVSQ